MGSMKEYFIDLQIKRAEEWIRERLSDESLDESSEEWQRLENEYSDYQEHFYEKAEWQAEIKWLKENGSSNIYKFFFYELNSLKEMATESLNESKNIAFLSCSNLIIKMAFAYAVTLLEAFLGDTLKALITEREDFLHNALRNVDEISKAKYTLSELSESGSNISDLAVKQVNEILFHNIPKVKVVYEQVLGVKLEIDLSKVSKITSLRHDIVHRNGYSKDKKPLNLNAQDLYQAIDDIKVFATSLQKQINER